MRVTILKGVLLVVGVAALMMVFGPPALAADDPEGKMIGPSMEIKKEAIDRPSLGVRDEVVVPEFTKESERPMSVPDPRANRVMPGRDPASATPAKEGLKTPLIIIDHDYFLNPG